MILAGPPAAAMVYVNDPSGLGPSVYGGGGSFSPALRPDDSPLGSQGRATLVSASTFDALDDAVSTGVKGGGGQESGSATVGLI